MRSVFIVLCFASYFCYLEATFTWKKCDEDRVYPLDIKHIDFSPSPLTFPGRNFLSLNASSNETMGRMELQLTVKKVMWFWSLRVPCMFNVGSCTYDDTCKLLDRMEEEDWAGVSANISSQIRTIQNNSGFNTTCPIGPQRFQIISQPMEFPALPGILRILSAGKYTVNTRLVEYDTRREMTCFDMAFKFAS